MAAKCRICRKQLNNGEIKYCRRHIEAGEKMSNKKKRLVIDEEFYWELKTDASSNSMELKDYIKIMFDEWRDENNDKEDDENNN